MESNEESKGALKKRRQKRKQKQMSKDELKLKKKKTVKTGKVKTKIMLAASKT